MRKRKLNKPTNSTFLPYFSRFVKRANGAYVGYYMGLKPEDRRNMPRGPNGEKRPADVVGCAVKVAKIATGELDEIPVKKSGRVRSGHAGAKARAEKLSREARHAIAVKAAAARWGR